MDTTGLEMLKYVGQIARDGIDAQADTEEEEDGDQEYRALVDGILESPPMAGIAPMPGSGLPMLAWLWRDAKGAWRAIDLSWNYDLIPT